MRPTALLPSVAVAIALALTSAPALRAQDSTRHEREGMWISAGFGSASNNLQCTGCQFSGPDDAWRGGSGGGAVYGAGWAVSDRLLLGVDFNPTGTGSNTRTAMIFLLLGVAQYYPLSSSGFHVKLGYGVASVTLSGNGGGAENYGQAGQLGVGYDIRFRWPRSIALTPYASYSATRLRDGGVRVFGNAGSITDLQNRSITQLGLAVRWY